MKEPDPELDRLTHDVIGAAIEVHRILGPGRMESTYEAALAIELGLRNIHFRQQVYVPLSYKGSAVGSQRIDLVVDSRLIVELKSVDSLLPIHTKQLLSYLRSTGITLGLVINFNCQVLKGDIRRVISS